MMKTQPAQTDKTVFAEPNGAQASPAAKMPVDAPAGCPRPMTTNSTSSSNSPAAVMIAAGQEGALEATRSPSSGAGGSTPSESPANVAISSTVAPPSESPTIANLNLTGGWSPNCSGGFTLTTMETSKPYSVVVGSQDSMNRSVNLVDLKPPVATNPYDYGNPGEPSAFIQQSPVAYHPPPNLCFNVY